MIREPSDDAVYSALAAWPLDELAAAWQRMVDLDPALAGRRQVLVQPVFLHVVVSALELPQDSAERSDPELDRGFLGFLDHVQNTGVAVRQLMHLGAVLVRQAGLCDATDVAIGLAERAHTVTTRLMTQAASLGLDSINSQTHTDSTTGLLNKRAFTRDVRALVESEEVFSFIYMDLDGLKRVNDRQGHSAGDALIKAMAVALTEVAASGSGETAYRWGGDEYGLLLEGHDGRRIASLVDQLQRAAPRFSYGVVASPRDGTQVDELLTLADGQIQAMKRLHRGSKGLVYVGAERLITWLKAAQVQVDRTIDQASGGTAPDPVRRILLLGWHPDGNTEGGK